MSDIWGACAPKLVAKPGHMEDRSLLSAAKVRVRRLTLGAVKLAGASAIGLCLLGLESHSVAFAQAGGQAPAPPASGSSIATASESYTIQPEDSIDISVIDHPDASRSYQVPSDGVIEPPTGGEINVKGMTVRDLRALLTKAYGKRYYNPEVIVNVHPSQQFVTVFVAGHGNKMALKSGEKVFEAVAAAGGLPLPRPELFKGTLLRSATAQTIPIDVDLLFKNDPMANLTLEPNDTVLVDEKEPVDSTVEVLGEVARPGPLTVPRDHSLVTVFQTVGGPTQAAELSDVVVEHDGKVTTIDMRNYRQDASWQPNVKIDAGDKLIVKTNRHEYYVFGAGPNTGVQVYPDESLAPALPGKTLTLSRALDIGHVSTEGVDLSKIKLTHHSEDGKATVVTVNVHKMMKDGDYTNDPLVYPGDIIFIPPSSASKGISLYQALTIIGGLGTAYGVFALFHH